MIFHCLFEQSGTFKNVFINNGHKAYDYDILNDYGQTDYQIDLFNEIEKEFDNLIGNTKYQTIFSKMTSDNDFIIAFFPCTYFCDFNKLIFRFQNTHKKGVKAEFNKLNIEKVIHRNQERAKYFEIYLKFCYICKQMQLKCIIENPASGGNTNYLVLFSPIDVAWYEKDRSLFGDKFKKPTNFFAINFEMKEDFIMFSQISEKQCIMKNRGCRERSEISSLYAENFYKRFLESNCKRSKYGISRGNISNKKKE